MTDLVVNTPLQRPALIPEHISDAALMECVRDFLHGEAYEICATRMEVTLQQFHSVIRTRQWQTLQVMYAEEFRATTGGRLVRIENELLNRVENCITAGVKCIGYRKNEDGQMEPYEFTRDLTPKELVSIGLFVGESNKRLDRLKEGDVSRKTFNRQEQIARLEAAAAAMTAKTVDGESQRVA